MHEYLKSTGLFTNTEIEYFLSLGNSTTLAKGDFFLKEGEIAKKVAFVKSGIFRSFYYSSNGEEVTYCFSFPNQLIAGYSSIITKRKTEENIEALTDCELLEFPAKVINELVEKHHNWALFAKQIAEDQYVRLEKRIFLLQKENALTRYKELLENKAQYLQKIPLGYLASYLGVSQRHLSRLRKQILF